MLMKMVQFNYKKFKRKKKTRICLENHLILNQNFN